MLDYTLVETLAAVIRTGSFEAAAAALHITPPAVSQRIRALEDRMGAPLVVRSQPARATEVGARLVRHAEDVQLLEHALGIAGSGPAEAPHLRIAVNADSLATWVIPALAAVEGYLFDLVIDDQDHSADWLRRGEVQAAVTSHAQPIAGCDAHPLGRLRYQATASPTFLRRWFPDGVTADALARAPALTFNSKDRLQSDWAREIAGQRVALPTHYIGASQAFVAAARAGLGWGMIPVVMVAEDLAQGRLVPLVPDRPLDTPLYWQASRLTSKAFSTLTQAMRQAAKAALLGA